MVVFEDEGWHAAALDQLCAAADGRMSSGRDSPTARLQSKGDVLEPLHKLRQEKQAPSKSNENQSRTALPGSPQVQGFSRAEAGASRFKNPLVPPGSSVRQLLTEDGKGRSPWLKQPKSLAHPEPPQQAPGNGAHQPGNIPHGACACPPEPFARSAGTGQQAPIPGPSATAEQAQRKPQSSGMLVTSAAALQPAAGNTATTSKPHQPAHPPAQRPLQIGPSGLINWQSAAPVGPPFHQAPPLPPTSTASSPQLPRLKPLPAAAAEPGLQRFVVSPAGSSFRAPTPLEVDGGPPSSLSSAAGRMQNSPAHLSKPPASAVQPCPLQQQAPAAATSGLATGAQATGPARPQPPISAAPGRLTGTSQAPQAHSQSLAGSLAADACPGPAHMQASAAVQTGLAVRHSDGVSDPLHPSGAHQHGAPGAASAAATGAQVIHGSKATAKAALDGGTGVLADDDDMGLLAALDAPALQPAHAPLRTQGTQQNWMLHPAHSRYILCQHTHVVYLPETSMLW